MKQKHTRHSPSAPDWNRLLKNIPRSPAWIQECTRRFMVGFHVWDYDQLPEYRKVAAKTGMAGILEQYDAGKFVSELKKARVQLFWFYNKCHQGNSYHPTDVPGSHIHSGMRGRDFFGETTEACLRNGIVPGCVYEFSDHRVMTDHPEWCHRVPAKGGGDMTDAIQGSRIGGPCLHGPYGDYAIAQVCETVERYPVQGLYVDFLGFFGHEAWACPHGCNERVRKAIGVDFHHIKDLSHEQYVAYLKWKFAEYDRYTRRMLKALRTVRPGLVFLHNAHLVTDTPNLQTYELAGRHCDYVSGDLFTLRAGTLQISTIGRTYANTSRSRPSEALLDAAVCTAADFATPKGIDSYRAELWTARSVNVTNCCSISMNIDGTFDQEILALTRKVFEEQIPFEPWLRDMEFEACVGVVRSQNTILFRPSEDQSKVAVPKVHDSQHALEFKGWTQALIASHQLWDVVQDYQLTADNLRRFRVLLLPNVGCLSKAQCEQIEAFAQRGGTVLATGETSLFDENGRRRRRPLLSGLFGIDGFGNREVFGERMVFQGPPLRPAEPWVAPFTNHFSGTWKIRENPDCRILAEVHARIGEKVIINAYAPTGRAGILRRRAGRGTCMYFAGLHGLEYRLWGVATQKRLMSRVLNLAVNNHTPVTCDGPETVELFAHRQTGKSHLVVSLVNNVSGIARSDGELNIAAGEIINHGFRFDETESMPAAAGVRLTFRPTQGQTIRRVYLAPNHVPLKLKRSKGTVAVEVPDFNVHAMVVAELAPVQDGKVS